MEENNEQKQATEVPSEESKQAPELADVLAKLTGSLERLETKLSEKPTPTPATGVPTPEELLQELEQSRDQRTQQPSPELDWEELRDNPQRLTALVLQQVETAYFRPLLERIELQRVRAEMAECQHKYSDFGELKDTIYALGMRNPYLSLEEAYQLAKAGKPVKPTEQAKPKTEEAKPKTEATGPTKATPRPKGEKRGITQASTLKSPKSVKEAAQQAIQEVLGS